MMRAKQILFLLLLSLGLPVAVQAGELFNSLLQESSMQWSKPDGFKEVAIVENEYLPYEKAVARADGELEIRYALRPLARMTIDYDDPHGALPDPNHIFQRVFQALTGNLSVGGNTPSREYKVEEAKSKFGADWAGMSIFDVDQKFAKGFKGAMLLAMHKNHIADAYIIFLFKDYEKAKAQINANLDTLRYLPEPVKKQGQPETKAQ